MTAVVTRNICYFWAKLQRKTVNTVLILGYFAFPRFHPS